MAAVAVLSAGLALLPAGAFASDGLEPIATSMKARARGGADTAVGDSALSQIDNPATLSLRPRGKITIDMDSELALINSHWDSPIDSSTSTVKAAPLFNTGLAFPINDRLTLGAAMHSRGGIGTTYYMRHLLIPFMKRRVGSDLKVIDLPFAAAYKLTDKLSIGFGPRVEIATAEFSSVLGPADVEFQRGWAVGGAFQFGLFYKATEQLSLGLGYRSPTWFNDLKGGQLRASLLGLPEIALGDVAIDRLHLPQRITAGAAWDATKWLKLVGEVRWINYTQSTLNATTIRLSGPVDLGYPLPLGYQDQWAFIVGAEAKLSKNWILGLGYHYCTPAVPPANMFPMGSIIAQHHVTLGLRYETERWWAGAGAVIGIPATLRGPGYSNIPLGVDYGVSTLHQTQHAVFVGFGIKL